MGRLPRDAHLPGGHRRRGHPVGYGALALVYLGVACGVVWILLRLARPAARAPLAAAPTLAAGERPVS